MSRLRDGQAVRVDVLTMSDSPARGEGTDRSGARIAACCGELGFPDARRGGAADGTFNVVPVRVAWADGGDIDLIVTTGGTGCTRMDRTPGRHGP